MTDISREMTGINCIFDEMTVIYPDYTNAVERMGRSGGAAAPPRRERCRRGAKPSSDWGDASKGGKAPLRLQSYPGALPRGRVVFRSAENFPYTSERPGGAQSAPTSERVQNSKKWPAGHFFDTRVSACGKRRRTRRCSSACRRSATAAAASRPSRQSPCPASRTKDLSAWTTPSSTE